jgi:hypothetical protein
MSRRPGKPSKTGLQQPVGFVRLPEDTMEKLNILTQSCQRFGRMQGLDLSRDEALSLVLCVAIDDHFADGQLQQEIADLERWEQGGRPAGDDNLLNLN